MSDNPVVFSKPYKGITKPYKGIIKNWYKVPFDMELTRKMYPNEDIGLGYYIRGTSVNHPQLGYCSNLYTSWVMVHDECKDTEGEGIIVTRNSVYKLEGAETPRKLTDASKQT